MTAWLKPNVVVEPLINQWYAWTFLISPHTLARYISHSHLKVMRSFVDAPDVHASALRNPDLIGGPFVQQSMDRVADVRHLLQRTEAEQRPLLALSAAIQDLDKLLLAHPVGEPMQALYAQIPAPLQGFVELVYDGHNRACARYQEPLLYRSDYYRPQNQSLALRILPDSDRRAFVMSTPRLAQDANLMLSCAFADPRLDALCRARFAPADPQQLAEQLQLTAEQRASFDYLFTDQPPRQAQAFTGEGLRVRYMGHACVLLQTRSTTILVDPLIGYEHPSGMARFSYYDLPEHIDYVLITHNHQDHVMLETLLQLRHRIGEILVPASQRGSLIDPSLRLALQQIGFRRVREMDALETVDFAEGSITPFPFLGEHGDLDIACKAAWRVAAEGRSVMCVADSDNIDPHLYHHLAQLFGPVDLLFIGMECEGAPYTWSYGPLISQAVSHRQGKARRLNGSNCERGLKLIEQLRPAQVCVYAMGQEPWLNYITSIHYTDESLAIVESDRLVAHCRAHGTAAERLLGRAEFHLLPQVQRHQPPRSLAVASDHYPIAAPVSAQMSQLASQQPPSTPAISTASAPFAAAPEAAAVPAMADDLGSLLDDLHQAGVQLAVNGDKLKIQAPKGALTPTLTARLQTHKSALLKLLNARVSAETRVSPSTETPSSNTQTAKTLPLDAQWPADLRPAWHCPADGQRLLLTGATGFIGAYLLSELLQQTRARIVCLVRSSPQGDAPLARVRNNLQAYGLWREHYTARLEAITGNLAQPHLGLSDDLWQSLANSLSGIYHNGAHVHHLLPYEQLRDSNLGGTLEVLRLVCQGMRKTLHFISTLSVLPPLALAAGQTFAENQPLAAQPIPQGGYNRSKWMAEHLVWQARDAGVPVTLFRPGPIAGDSRSGVFNRNDFLYRLMQGYITSGMAPDGAMPLDLLPVDYLAKALVFLSLQSESRGACFHLLHPQPVSSDAIFAACAAEGHALRRVGYDAWLAHLRHIAQTNREHPLYPLVALFASRAPAAPASADSGHNAVPYDTRISQALLQRAPFRLPTLDVALFRTYLRAMRMAPQLSAVAP